MSDGEAVPEDDTAACVEALAGDAETGAGAVVRSPAGAALFPWASTTTWGAATGAVPVAALCMGTGAGACDAAAAVDRLATSAPAAWPACAVAVTPFPVASRLCPSAELLCAVADAIEAVEAAEPTAAAGGLAAAAAAVTPCAGAKESLPVPEDVALTVSDGAAFPAPEDVAPEASCPDRTPCEPAAEGYRLDGAGAWGGGSRSGLETGGGTGSFCAGIGRGDTRSVTTALGAAQEASGSDALAAICGGCGSGLETGGRTGSFCAAPDCIDAASWTTALDAAELNVEWLEALAAGAKEESCAVAEDGQTPPAGEETSALEA